MAGIELARTLAEVNHPIVGVIMGSDSDLKFVLPAVEVLDEFKVPNETRIVSAHRTPDWMHEYAIQAEPRGILTIIAAAGGSSHLQGMTASETILPVEGIAIESSPDPLNSSFGSTLRMPSDGGPLAVMGKNEAGAINASLHIIRWLAHIFPELKPKLVERQKAKALEVREKDNEIVAKGPYEYRTRQIIKEERARRREQQEIRRLMEEADHGGQ